MAGVTRQHSRHDHVRESLTLVDVTVYKTSCSRTVMGRPSTRNRMWAFAPSPRPRCRLTTQPARPNLAGISWGEVAMPYLNVSPLDRTSGFRVTGELDMASVPELEEALPERNGSGPLV